MKQILLTLSVALLSITAAAQTTIRLDANTPGRQIPKEIYGQFAEHLGRCIYGGIWVGPESAIPNQDGYRLDVLHALQDLHVPVMRWPGGCFADNYHWMDGIGPQAERPKMVNTNWGGTTEDNSFGTHEFLNLCELLGCEPYISANVGSGTVEEMAKWVEYMTSDDDTPMANLRRKNGREKAWKVKYLGVGNESWGCGGQMTPEYYSNLYRRYAEYSRDFSGNHLYKVASGASDYDYNWTKVLMQNIGNRMSGISLHYYTVKGWDGSKGAATRFTPDEYYQTLGKCLGIEPVIRQHIAIMDQYDPEKKINLLVDEWGTWWDVEEGTNEGHLFQQQTMRDAMVAALSLNVFHKYSDRIRMTNIAQVVNVLQAMILTEGDKMVLTPTYYVFKAYAAHQDAMWIPLTIATAEERPAEGVRASVPKISATASEKDGTVTLCLANTDLSNSESVDIDLTGIAAGSKPTAEILTAAQPTAYNSFDAPEAIRPTAFTGMKYSKGHLTVKMPKMSIICIKIAKK